LNKTAPQNKKEFIFKMAKRPLPQDLTSYDFLKTLAIILMIIDHVGTYFFPDAAWFRVFGRMCVPIWFFLIGYANSRDLGPMIIAGALVLIVSDLVIGRTIFALNILVSIIIVRLVLDYIMAIVRTGTFRLVAVCIILVALLFPLSIFWEYGTMGVMIAMLGYMVRHQGSDIDKKERTFGYLMFCIFVFVVYQQLLFDFNQLPLAIMTIGATLSFFLVVNFKSATFPKLTEKLPVVVTGFLRICGRHTLEIYVLHLLLFKITALSIGMEGYNLFQPDLFGELGADLQNLFQGGV
jgi:uncharacterized membrane protein YcfT